jgi:L-rhamnose mutarotase
MSHTIIAILTVALAMTMLPPGAFSAEAPATSPPKRAARYGSVIGLRPEKLDQYRKLHAAIWPEVAKAVHEANIRNYSIYLRKLPDGNYYLFSYFEYVGHDFKADMARLAANPDVKRWWSVTDPCQSPLGDRNSGEWWAGMKEVFHQD